MIEQHGLDASMARLHSLRESERQAKTELMATLNANPRAQNNLREAVRDSVLELASEVNNDSLVTQVNFLLDRGWIAADIADAAKDQ